MDEISKQLQGVLRRKVGANIHSLVKVFSVTSVAFSIYGLPEKYYIRKKV
jgi:hypothetical protein